MAEKCSLCPEGFMAESPGSQSCIQPKPIISENVVYDKASSCEALVRKFAPELLTTSDLNATEAIRIELGNGFCFGFSLNTEACGWDGGDCCESTCIKLNGNNIYNLLDNLSSDGVSAFVSLRADLLGTALVEPLLDQFSE